VTLVADVSNHCVQVLTFTSGRWWSIRRPRRVIIRGFQRVWCGGPVHIGVGVGEVLVMDKSNHRGASWWQSNSCSGGLRVVYVWCCSMDGPGETVFFPMAWWQFVCSNISFRAMCSFCVDNNKRQFRDEFESNQFSSKSLMINDRKIFYINIHERRREAEQPEVTPGERRETEALHSSTALTYTAVGFGNSATNKKLC
jgi:hypothetical protein